MDKQGERHCGVRGAGAFALRYSKNCHRQECVEAANYGKPPLNPAAVFGLQEFLKSLFFGRTEK
jgi:hypothetical protein